MNGKQKKIFISHYGADDDSVKGLKKLLEDNACILSNSSIENTKIDEASDLDYIKCLLKKRIQWAEVIVVLIEEQTHKRDWVNWEIEQAYLHGILIIGLFVQGAKDFDVPVNLEKYGDVLVGWNSGKIIEAINGKYIGWMTSHSTPWVNGFSMHRSRDND
jgi:Thoeris protein ThsB, TIR-like domain